MFDADIDIDVTKAKRDEIIKLFGDDVVIASNIINDKLVSHQAGVYFQSIPKDKITGLAAIPYDRTSAYGYFKIDILPLNLLDTFNNKSEINRILKKPINWKLLEDEVFVSKLFHISKHFTLVNKVKPRSIEELADVLALIRPEKIKLIDKYLDDKVATRPELYRREGNSMKKSHTIPYAMLVVVNMYLLEHGILQ